MADVAGGDGGFVSDEAGRGAVDCVGKNEAMGAVVGGGAEETGDDHVRWHGADDGGRRVAGVGEVEVVDDEFFATGGGDKIGGEAGGVGGALRDGGGGGGQFGERAAVVEMVPLLVGKILRAGDGGEAVEGALPSGGDGAAGVDETEGGVETEINPGYDAIEGGGAAGQKVGEGDIDAIGGRAVHRPSGAVEALVSRGGGDGAVTAFARASPALLVERGDDGERMAGGTQGVDQGVKKRRCRRRWKPVGA